MRIKSKKGTMSVNAVAGTYVVLLGININKAAAKGLLGFAVERTDHTENKRYWLKGFKTFEADNPKVEPGSSVTTLKYPVQAFMWGDYTAKPDHKYTYKVVAMRGTPGKLEKAEFVEVAITTESETGGIHSVFFNRGVAASQLYVRRFGNVSPEEVAGGEAWKWLSRGLLEALQRFILQAADKGYGLRAAIYEFQYEPVLKAFKEAAERGADVKIIVDSRENAQNYPNKKNRAAIEQAGLTGLIIDRKSSPNYISHNKFIVLLKDGEPAEVWTGSTNITRGGIFGHSNVGHIVRDRNTAGKYLEYWKELSRDPEAKELREACEKISSVPKPYPGRNSINTVFSPRKSLEALEFYADMMDKSKNSVFMTAAFGLDDLFEKVLSCDRDFLRYVLLEKEDDQMDMITRDPDNMVAVGSVIEENLYERWIRENSVPSLNSNVKYIHTKYMLVDPLSKDPVVITGSANFSNASTRNNDENMLVIRGDTKVADIYLTEFMRLFNHYYFRRFLKAHKAKSNSMATRYLTPDDSWCKPYFEKDTAKYKEKNYFK